MYLWRTSVIILHSTKLYTNGIIQLTEIRLPFLHKDRLSLLRVTGAFCVAKSREPTPSSPHDNMGRWRPSLPVASLKPALTSWVILSVYFTSFPSSTQLMNVSFSRLSSGPPSSYRRNPF